MKTTTSLTRRHLLKAVLGTAAVLGLPSLAHASTTPFELNTSWAGSAGSVAGNVSLQVNTNFGNWSGGVLKLNGVSTAVSITWNPLGEVQIKDGNGQVSISGQITEQATCYGFIGTYSTKGLPGLSDVSGGAISMVRANPIGLVVDDPTTANIPSISIVPPDFKGLLESKLFGIGEGSLSTGGGHELESRVSVVSGKTVLGGSAFGYVMTFAPRPEADGSFRFDLVGNSLDSGKASFATLSGRFYPSTGRTVAGLVGGYQLLSLRSEVLDLGAFSFAASR